MKAKHVLLNLTVLFLLIGVFAACSNTGNEGGEKTSEPGVAVTDEQVELRIAWWGGQTRHEKYHQIIENFEKKYPHIKSQNLVITLTNSPRKLLEGMLLTSFICIGPECPIMPSEAHCSA